MSGNIPKSVLVNTKKRRGSCTLTHPVIRPSLPTQEISKAASPRQG